MSHIQFASRLVAVLVIILCGSGWAQTGPIYDTCPDRGQVPVCTGPAVWGIDADPNNYIKDVDVAAAGHAEALFAYHKKGHGVGLAHVVAGAPGTALASRTGSYAGFGAEDVSAGYYPGIAGERYMLAWAGGTDPGGLNFARADLVGGIPAVVTASHSVIFENEVSGGGYGNGRLVDKPWLSAGFEAELYISFSFLAAGTSPFTPAEYHFARTTNAGTTWKIDRFKDLSAASLGSGLPFVQGSVSRSIDDRPWFVAYRKTQSDRWYFATAVDLANGKVRFEELLRPQGNALFLQQNEFSLASLIPGPYDAKVVPFIAADPTSDNRFYLVYYDVAAVGSTDVGVVCAVFERETTTAPPAGWSLTRTVNLNTSPGSTQFNPAAVVDDSGRLHVIYYDNKDRLPESKKFDLLHSYSEDQGQTFTHTLFENPQPSGMDDAPLDFDLVTALDPLADDFWPGEYPAIDARRDDDGMTVWMGWPGTAGDIGPFTGKDLAVPGFVLWATRAIWPAVSCSPSFDVLREDPAGPPVTCSTWRPVIIDHSFQPGWTTDYVFVQKPLSPPVCDPVRGLQLVPLVSPAPVHAPNTIAISVPNDLSLVGESFVCQVVSEDIDLPAAGTRWLFTNGLSIIIGLGPCN